jgi:hypothetical protein
MDNFGQSVAVSGNRAIIGAILDSDVAYLAGSAYIFNLNSSLPCPTDLNGSGSTDLVDLNLVLGAFGEQDDGGDTNGDGVVDLIDLNAVLAAFGTQCS